MAAMITIANANALHIPLPDRSVQCIVTSPPYWGLRDYGTAGQIGLESTPAAYVASIVAVMRECWRVLKDDGVLFLNLGDSYFGDSPTRKSGAENFSKEWDKSQTASRGGLRRSAARIDSLKPKDLIGIPWRVAFALQYDGWYLRQDIIWHKTNPMPESVTDRCTKAHEYIFLLAKQARYYYDAEAIKEPIAEGTAERYSYGFNSPDKKREIVETGKWHTGKNGRDNLQGDMQLGNGRNRRSVWTVATQPYSGAHFATFPPALIEPMILAGTSQRGECPHCGKAWVRVVERNGETTTDKRKERGYSEKRGNGGSLVKNNLDYAGGHGNNTREINTIGWRPQCNCIREACPNIDLSSAGWDKVIDRTAKEFSPIPQTVLDPFAGSGTTGAVAVKHGRRAVLLDLNTKYIDLQFERTNGVQITMPFETSAPNSPA